SSRDGVPGYGPPSPPGRLFVPVFDRGGGLGGLALPKGHPGRERRRRRRRGSACSRWLRRYRQAISPLPRRLRREISVRTTGGRAIGGDEELAELVGGNGPRYLGRRRRGRPREGATARRRQPRHTTTDPRSYHDLRAGRLRRRRVGRRSKGAPRLRGLRR